METSDYGLELHSYMFSQLLYGLLLKLVPHRLMLDKNSCPSRSASRQDGVALVVGVKGEAIEEGILFKRGKVHP